MTAKFPMATCAQNFKCLSMNNTEFTEDIPFSLLDYPKTRAKDLPTDYHALRQWFHDKNPECLPLYTSRLYCKPHCPLNEKGPHELCCHNVNTNDWKQFKFSCPGCRKVYPGVPAIFANLRSEFRDLSDALYIITFCGSNLTEIHDITGVPMFTLFELKMKFEATILEAKRLVNRNNKS